MAMCLGQKLIGIALPITYFLANDLERLALCLHIKNVNIVRVDIIFIFFMLEFWHER